MNVLQLAHKYRAVAEAICDHRLPNRLNLSPSSVNMIAILPIALLEEQVRMEGAAAYERKLRNLYPEAFTIWPGPTQLSFWS